VTGASLFEPTLLTTGLVIAGLFIGGAGVGFLMVQTGTLLQTLSPRAILGSISGYFQSLMVTGQLISILGVPLVVPQVLGLSAFMFLITISLGVVLIYMTVSRAMMQRRQFVGAGL